MFDQNFCKIFERGLGKGGLDYFTYDISRRYVSECEYKNWVLRAYFTIFNINITEFNINITQYQY